MARGEPQKLDNNARYLHEIDALGVGAEALRRAQGRGRRQVLEEAVARKASVCEDVERALEDGCTAHRATSAETGPDLCVGQARADVRVERDDGCIIPAGDLSAPDPGYQVAREDLQVAKENRS
mgnify:CR=1 FL=1